MNTQNVVEIALRAKDEVSQVVDKMADGTKTQFEKMKTFVMDHWKVVALAAAAVSAAIAKAFWDVTEAAAKAEDAERDLIAAMQTRGEYTPQALKDLKDYATAMQQLTKYEDDAIVAIEANLKGYGMTTQEVKDATKATLDLATAKKMDLWAASELIGKAFIGETQTLTRYGLTIQDNISDGEKFAAVLALINERFGGRAQADADTYHGKLVQLKNTYNNLKEAMGGVITNSDAFNKGMDLLKNFIESLTKFIEEHPTAAKIGAIAIAVTGLVTALGTLALILAKVAPLLAGLGVGAGLTALLAALPQILLAGGFIAGGWAAGNYILSGGTSFINRDNAWEENAAVAEANRQYKEAQEEQKALQARLNQKRAAQGIVSDQSVMGNALRDIRNKVESEDMDRLTKLEREKDLREMGFHSERDFQGYMEGQRQFREASKAGLRAQDEQMEEAEYEEWVANLDKRQIYQIEQTKTRTEEFYTWMADRTAEAATLAEGNFSNYFFDMFTGKITTLKDAWMGFCNSIYNAWAQTLAQMAAQKVTSKLFGILQLAAAGGLPKAQTSVGAAPLTEFGVVDPAIFGIPRMAEGGVLTRPTFTFAGETGPEAFVPLSRGRAIPVEMRGGSAPQVTINIVNPLDGESVERMLASRSSAVIGMIQADYQTRGPMYDLINRR